MLPTEDAEHAGNSAKYRSGKPCRVRGCKNPAGTVWGPSWCRQHNHERLERIGSALDDAATTMRLRRMVNEATDDLRRCCAELERQRDVAAAVAWRRIGECDRVPGKAVLVTRGAGWITRYACWMPSRPQRCNPDLKYNAGWFQPGGHLLMDPDEPLWIADIPPQPSVPEGGQ